MASITDSYMQLLKAFVVTNLRDALAANSLRDPSAKAARERLRQQAINWFFDDGPKRVCEVDVCKGCEAHQPGKICRKLMAQEVFDLLGLDIDASRERLLKVLP